jgi:hypothetical protein
MTALFLPGVGYGTIPTLATLGITGTADNTTFLRGDGTWATPSGAVPTAITVANEAADTTCFLLFATAATGDLGPKSNAGLTFNSSTGTLTATAFAGSLTGNVTGNLTGNADTATSATTADTATAIADGAVSSTAKLADDVVTYAKLQNVTANSVLARAAGTDGDVSAVALAASQLFGRGSTGDVAAITLGTNLSLDGATLNATGGSGTVNPATNAFRISPATGVYVPTAAVTGTANLYLVPDGGNQIALYNGSAWEIVSSSEVTLSLATLAASTLHDLFLYNDGGAIGYEWVAWTNDTTRATAPAQQDGVWSKSGALTRRYAGTIRTNSSGAALDWNPGGLAAGGTAAVLSIWNESNRVTLRPVVQDSTNSWTYNTATWRSSNNSTTMRITWVTGRALEWPSARFHQQVNTRSSTAAEIGVGYDSTSAFTGFPGRSGNTSVVTVQAGADPAPAIGLHYFQALENGFGSGTQTFYGDNGDATTLANVLTAEITM